MRPGTREYANGIRLFLAAVVAVSALGCGRGHARVTGRLTLDGKPAPAGLLLEFQPETQGSSPSLGRTDSEGRYELWKTGTQVGVEAGRCLVRISIAPASADRGPPKLPPELEKLVIPPQYGSASTLVHDVKPGVQTIDIDIKL